MCFCTLHQAKKTCLLFPQQTALLCWLPVACFFIHLMWDGNDFRTLVRISSPTQLGDETDRCHLTSCLMSCCSQIHTDAFHWFSLHFFFFFFNWREMLVFGVCIIFSGVVYVRVLLCLVDLSHRENHLCCIFATFCHNHTAWHALWEIVDLLPYVCFSRSYVLINKITHCVCVRQYRLCSLGATLFRRVFSHSETSTKLCTSLLWTYQYVTLQSTPEAVSPCSVDHFHKVACTWWKLMLLLCM